MKKANIKKIIVILVSLIIVMTILNCVNSYIQKENQKIENSIHGVVISKDALLYKKAKEQSKTKEELEIGSNVYILEDIQDEQGTLWYEVKYKNQKGYIKQEDVGYYKKSEEQIVLMSDVSKFNIQYETIKGTNDYERFLVQNNIQYVYIRAGGRGYGGEGNFYEDTEYKKFVEACEYLKIPYGFYFIDEAINKEEIDEEVQWIKNFIDNNKSENLVLPIAIDIEQYPGQTVRTSSIWDERAELISYFQEELEKIEIESIIYTNAKIADKYFSKLDTKFWIAYYPEDNKLPDVWYDELNQEPAKNEELMEKVIAWQFTENGIEEMVEEQVDLSLVKNGLTKY